MAIDTQAARPGGGYGRMALRPSRGAPETAQLVAGIACSILGGVALAATGDPVLVAGLLGGGAFVALGLVAPALFLSLLLLVRPLFDGPLSGTVGGLPSANAAGAVALLLVGVTAILVARKPRFVDTGVTASLSAIIVVSALASTQAFLELGGEIGVEPLAELARLGALLAIYLLAGHVFGDEAGVRRLFLLAVLSAVAPIAVGLVEFAQGVEPLPGYEIGRINGTFVGPLPFSAFLAVAALILIQMPRDLLHPAAKYTILVAALVALVATYSREGWLIFLVGLTILQWNRNKGVLVAALAIVSVLVIAVPNVKERTLPFSGDGSARSAEESFNWRLANWEGLLDRYGERPLTGWGLRSTAYVNPRQTAPEPGAGYDAHNTAVRVLVEGGPLLLAAYVGFFAVILASVRRMTRDSAWALTPLARALLASWIGVAIIAVVSDDPLEATATMYVLLALTGAMGAAFTTRRSRSQLSSA